MPWGRVDDKLHSHPKADKAGIAAMGLWALALSYACDQLTDGFVSRERVTKIAGALGPKLAAKLVAAKLWHPANEPCGDPDCDAYRVDDDGYRFHGWAERQPIKAEVEAERARKVEAGRKGGQRKAANLAQSVAPALAPASSAPAPMALPPFPDPIPVPIPVGSADQSEARTPEADARALVSIPVPTGDRDLDAFARVLASEGMSFGVSCVERLDAFKALTQPQITTLRRIHDERASSLRRQASGSLRSGANTLQQPAPQGAPTWTVGQEI